MTTYRHSTGSRLLGALVGRLADRIHRDRDLAALEAGFTWHTRVDGTREIRMPDLPAITREYRARVYANAGTLDKAFLTPDLIRHIENEARPESAMRRRATIDSGWKRSTMTNNPTPSKSGRLSFGLLVLIVLAVGAMAGLASFTHVHDWTMHNSPTGTHSCFGWANAVITELVPTAALIIIAQRRRTGGSTTYPMALLIAALALSLTAQLAVATPTVFGWIVSAIPSVFFFALSKLVFTATSHPAAVTDPQTRPASPTRPAAPARITPVDTPPTTVPASTPAPSLASSSSDTATREGLLVADTRTPAPTIPSIDALRSTATPAPEHQTTAAAIGPTPARTSTTGPAAATPAATLADLLPGARRLAKRRHHPAPGRLTRTCQAAARSPTLNKSIVD